MARHQNWRTDMKRQAIHDRSVIDHLVEAFHAGQMPGLAAQRPAQSLKIFWLSRRFRESAGI